MTTVSLIDSPSALIIFGLAVDAMFIFGVCLEAGFRLRNVCNALYIVLALTAVLFMGLFISGMGDPWCSALILYFLANAAITVGLQKADMALHPHTYARISCLTPHDR